MVPAVPGVTRVPRFLWFLGFLWFLSFLWFLGLLDMELFVLLPRRSDNF